MSLDQKLRQRIAWLNKVGGFENAIIYTRVAKAAEGLEEAKVMEVLKYLEENWEKVRDATSWVCASLQKARRASMGLEPDVNEQLRKRIWWLNNTGGFENAISYSKIAEASVGVPRNKVMQVLKYLEDSWERVEDPTAWVCSALRKAASSQEDAAVDPPARWSGGGGAARAGAPPVTSALWRRISWLNGPGGFNHTIDYDKVAEEAEGMDQSKALELLQYLEENWQKVSDPTAWVCSSLRRARVASDGLSDSVDRQLRGRIRWLNTEGGFRNTILYNKVAEAAVGVEGRRVMEILKFLEDRCEEVEDPTAWVCAALGKVKGPGGRPPREPGPPREPPKAEAQLTAGERQRQWRRRCPGEDAANESAES